MNALRALIVPLLLALAWAHPAEPQARGPSDSGRAPREGQGGHGPVAMVDVRDARQIVQSQGDGNEAFPGGIPGVRGEELPLFRVGPVVVHIPLWCEDLEAATQRVAGATRGFQLLSRDTGHADSTEAVRVRFR